MIRKEFILAFASCFFGVFLFGTPFASAQTVTLTILDPTISFSDADPDLQPTVTATPDPVRVRVRVVGNGGNNWRLTHQATGDLSSSIPISNISWTVAPQPPFINGTMSRLAPQTAAQDRGNVNNVVGNFTFHLQNLWSYNTGTFSQVTTFTLSAP